MILHPLMSFMLAAIGVFSMNCSSDPASPEPVELTALEKKLVQSDNTFGLKLFKEIVADETGKNVFISPQSISMALGMTLNGANGETKQAMQNTLELAGLTDQQINESYESLIDLLVGLDPKVKFQIADHFFLSNSRQIIHQK